MLINEKLENFVCRESFCKHFKELSNELDDKNSKILGQNLADFINHIEDKEYTSVKFKSHKLSGNRKGIYEAHLMDDPICIVIKYDIKQERKLIDIGKHNSQLGKHKR